MFNDSVENPPSVEEWLDRLRAVEPGSRKGALVARNLEDDGNVPLERGERFVREMESVIEADPQGDTLDVYSETLKNLNIEHGFDSLSNEPNMLEEMPFEELGRIVPLEDFSLYNLKTPPSPEQLRDSRFLENYFTKYLSPQQHRKRVKGLIAGGTCCFATSTDAVLDAGHTLKDADEVRNGLGLDDAERFGKGKYLVGFVYAEGEMEDAPAYRPTVLEAQDFPAFLPSGTEPENPTPGRTQHLDTGEQVHPEIVHAPIPVEQTTMILLSNPLQTDPPDEYKEIRLRRR